MKIAIVHDYLTQRGGAERVVLSMTRAFPDAPVYTSLYDPEGTFPEFAEVDVRPLWLNRFGVLRRNHRLALPFLAPAFSSCEVEADVVLSSSSGWAHGVRARGRHVVYCYAPARWLYQTERYLGGPRPVVRLALGALRPWLVSWDRRAAARAIRYVTLSTVVRERIREAYGIDAEVLPPPPAVDPTGRQRPMAGVSPGFVLCVSRLLPYKNVRQVIEAFRELPTERLVIAGSGPEEGALRNLAPPNVHLAGRVEDDELRWLYGACAGLVAASYEDYGLTPLEAACFGKPAVVLRDGGFLDTLLEGATGVYFDRPTPEAIRAGVSALLGRSWDPAVMKAHARSYSEERFIERLREIVEGRAEAG